MHFRHRLQADKCIYVAFKLTSWKHKIKHLKHKKKHMTSNIPSEYKVQMVKKR